MTDYLTRLVNRAHGNAAALHPWIASRYDPGPSRQADADPSVAIGEDQPTVASADTTLAAESFRHRAPARSRAVSTTSNADAGPDRIAEKVLPSTIRPTPGPTSPPEPGDRPAVPHRTIFARPADQNTGAAAERSPDGARVERDYTPVVPVIAPGTPEQSAPAIDGRAVPDVVESRAPQPEAMLLPARLDVPSVAPPEAESPVIRVTIGRIDVRAVSPPAPAPKRSRPPAPRMSLEDYLRSRSRGERR